MELSEEKYVSLTTYRRNGDPVATPVWIAPLAGGRAGFTTAADSGKVKRIRANPSVTLAPSDIRGNVATGSASRTATADVVIGGDSFEEIRAAVSTKYGFKFALVHLGGRFKKLIGKGEAANCGIVVTFD